MSKIADAGYFLGNAISEIGQYNAKAAGKANAISKGAQTAAANFNQGSVNNANTITSNNLAAQYAYNSAAAADANAFTQSMWERAAQFNSEEAQKNRDWQERMANTMYQRAVKDMKAAGLNPILAATNGINTSAGSGSAASISGASGALASGGVIGGQSASVGGYSGQMENLSGTLGLIAAVIGGISSATSALGSLGDIGKGFGEAIAKIFEEENKKGGIPFANVEKNSIASWLLGGGYNSSSGYWHKGSSGKY